MRRLLQAIALLCTTWVLVATSRPTAPCGNTAERITFRVEGTCGPSGIVTIESDSSCRLEVIGAREVQLPPSGSQVTSGPLMATVIGLGGHVRTPDGGPLPLADGGVREPDETCPGCLDVRRDCRGVADGGALELSCTDQDGESCTAVLLP